jgi:large subunit ribosomal protein L5
MVPRLKTLYKNEIAPRLMEKFEYRNPMQVPRLERVVINMGLGKLTDGGREDKVIDNAVNEVSTIAGQRPVVTKAKKSIAGFKLREGAPIGCMVTLRGNRMYEFLDRLVNLALPRVRDFRGVSPSAFDGSGNYTLGMREHIIFPEIDYGKVERVKGMNITIVTTAQSDGEARELLKGLGMPFREG